MIIKNPTINDIEVRDYITFKKDVTFINHAFHKETHQVFTCEEGDPDKWGWRNKECKYEVRSVNRQDNIIHIYGPTKTPNKYYRSGSLSDNKYRHETLVVNPSDIETLYSSKPCNDYQAKVLETIVYILDNMYNKLKEYISEDYLNLGCGSYDSEFDPCNLEDYIMNSHEYSEIEGFAKLVERFRHHYLAWGEYEDGSPNKPILNSLEINDNDADEDIKDQLNYLIRTANTDYFTIVKEIKSNSIQLGSGWYYSNSKVTDKDRNNILNGLEQFYSWFINTLSPLVDTNIYKVHNERIDKLIKNAEDKIKSYECQIENMFKMIEAKQKEIENLKTQYK